MIWILIGAGSLFLLGLIMNDAIRDEARGVAVQVADDRPKKSYLSKTKNRVNAATLLCVAVYTLITFRIWLTQRDTEERQLRAYLIINHVEVTCPDCASGVALPLAMSSRKNIVDINVENNGQTPAYEVVGTNNSLYVPTKDAQIPAGHTFPDYPQAGIVSKGNIGRDKRWDSIPDIPLEVVHLYKSVGDGTGTLFIYGHYDYCDIFNEPHSTAYCFRYVPNVGYRMPLCDRFNGEIPARSTCPKP
jgi:hypothetical protein